MRRHIIGDFLKLLDLRFQICDCGFRARRRVMSIRSVMVVMLALVCGVSAAVGVTKLRQPAEAQAAVETVPVVVAALDIGPGKMVSAADLDVRKWPKTMLSKGTIDKIESAV